MNTKDFSIYESGNGGELVINNNDIVLSETLFNQVYLALFGGNIEAVTRGDEPINEERLDYWQNSLFYGENPAKQMNSETEALMANLELNSSGRLKLIQAVKNDLSYLSQLATITVDVFFTSENRVEILIKFDKSDNSSDVFSFVYDNSRNEVIINNNL